MTKVIDALAFGLIGTGDWLKTHAIEIALVVWTINVFAIGLSIGIAI